MQFDFAFLGRYVFDKNEDRKIDNNWCYPGLSYNTQAYVLTNQGAQKLLNTQFKQNLIPVDEFTTATHMSHRRPDIEQHVPYQEHDIYLC